MSKKINVGGQAVIEGVMMRSPKSLAIAVRKPNGEIVIKNDVWVSISDKVKILKKPFLRGFVILIESLINGISALTFSANQAIDESEEGEKEDRIHPLAMAMTIVTALGLGILLFVVLPHYLTMFVSKSSGGGYTVDSYMFHLIDGIIKIAVFILYVWGISLMSEIKRVFMYHGAEHKSIYAFEAGEELTVENARKYSTLHPRCGTSFILIVLLISIFIFSLIFPMLPKFPELPKYVRNIIYIFIKIPLMIPISGISYEIIKLSAKKRDNPILKMIMAPGLMMQKITTKEPTDDQLEVAITALKAALQTEESVASEAVAKEKSGERKETLKSQAAIKV